LLYAHIYFIYVGVQFTKFTYFYTLAYLFLRFLLSCVCSSLSFAMITYSVGADEIASLKTHLKNEEPSVRVVEDLEKFSL